MRCDNINIRPQTNSDSPRIYAVNKAAFETEAEAKLVNAIIESDTPNISLVAEQNNQIIGHLLLSKMHCKNNSNLVLYGLAPMAVLPEFQQQGIGKKLIHTAIDAAKKNGIDAIFVLGHPDYYPKFGFVSTEKYNITSSYDVPAEVFMLLDLTNQLDQLNGETVYYCSAFDAL